MIIAPYSTYITVGDYYIAEDKRIFKIVKIESYKGLSEITLEDNQKRILKVLSCHWIDCGFIKYA